MSISAKSLCQSQHNHYVNHGTIIMSITAQSLCQSRHNHYVNHGTIIMSITAQWNWVKVKRYRQSKNMPFELYKFMNIIYIMNIDISMNMIKIYEYQYLHRGRFGYSWRVLDIHQYLWYVTKCIFIWGDSYSTKMQTAS